jgi:FkbM family methyltransferase
MPATQFERRRTLFWTVLPWRKAFPKRVVKRHVQGVDLYMPWAHLLPDYAKSRPTYGQNLVDLAAGLAARSTTGAPLQVLDVGANIGDSAAQIIARTNGRVLCVEGDPYWAEFLRKNLGSEPRAVIEEVLLTGDEGEWATSAPVREGGTTRFSQDTGATGTTGSLPALSARALRAKHTEFDQLRLVKSDTDGFDPVLVPAVLHAWSDVGPVVFFEFDPGLARIADERDPNLLWEELAGLGYDHLLIWDNTGDPLGHLPIAEAAAAATETLTTRPNHLGYQFWDVAACRGDDADAIAVFDQLMPEAYSPLGTWR